MEGPVCGSCGNPDARLYPCGYRCASCTPARRLGRPEPDSARYCAPLRCYCGGQCGATISPIEPITPNVADFRAVASGKRRSSLGEYRAAQAEVQAQKDRCPR